MASIPSEFNYLFELIILFVLSGSLPSDAFRETENFAKVTDNNGSSVCALVSDNPNRISELLTRSLLGCAGQCMVDPDCDRFNFWSADRSCDLFPPTESTLSASVPGCSHYQVGYTLNPCIVYIGTKLNIII